MNQRQAIQKQIREQFETAYKERLLSMKLWFEKNQYQTLQMTISDAYKKVLQDEILTTMIGDKTTIPFIEERVKELFIEIIGNEREVLIEKLGLQLSDLNFHYGELKKKYMILQKQNENVSEKTFNEKKHFEIDKIETSSSLQKKNEQIYELKLKIEKFNMESRESTSVIEQQKKQIMFLLNDKDKLTQRLSYLESQTDNLVEKFQMKDSMMRENEKKENSLKKKMKEMEQNHQEQMEILKRKYQKKVGDYKAKIEEYKERLIRFAKEQKEKQMNEYSEKADLRDLEKKLMTITRESERKIQDMKSAKDKDKLELEKKYEGRFKDLQQYYDRLLQEKVMEAERCAIEAAARIREEETKLKDYIEFLENNSEPLQNYEKVVSENQNLKGFFQRKLEEADAQISNIVGENEKLKNIIEVLKRQQKEMQGRIYELETHTNEGKRKIIIQEEEIQSGKQIEKRLKKMLKDSEGQGNYKDEEIVTLKSNINELQSEKIQYMSMLKEKEIYLKDTQDQLGLAEDRFAKEKKQNQQGKQKLIDMEKQVSESKQTLAQKQHKLKEQSQQSLFTIEGLNNKILKSTNQINLQAEQIEELQRKNKQCIEENSGLKKEVSEFESKTRKLELESKYHREAEQSLRQQHQAYIADFKKKIEEKNRQIDQLEENETLSKRKMKEIEFSFAEKEEELTRKNKKILLGIKKAKKLFIEEVDNFNRKLKDTKSYIQGLQNLYLNEVLICQKNLVMKMSDEFRRVNENYVREVKQMKEQCEEEKVKCLANMKSQIEKQETHFKERLESEVKNLQSVTAAKERDIERLQKEKKKLLNEKDQTLQGSRNLQKIVHQQQVQWENERVQQKGKIGEIIREFDSQKEKIIQKHERERATQEGEMQEIMETLKIIKKDLQTTKSRHQQEKNQWKNEMYQIAGNQKQFKNMVASRQEELRRLNIHLQQLIEANTRYEHEIKELRDKYEIGNRSSAELEFQLNKVTGQMTIQRQKAQRLTEENLEMQRQQEYYEEEKKELVRMKERVEGELKEIKLALAKGNKSQELRALQQLDLETKELTSKVNQLKRVNVLITENTPLRS